jgi:predicted AAA+ superfamily ATPase
MLIRRDHYLNKLINRRNNGLIKIVTGIRRCGKSTLLFRLFRDYLLGEGVSEDHIIEVSFDVRSSRALRHPDRLLQEISRRMSDRDIYYILLDEVQLLEDFEAVLNELLRMPNTDIYVTGSNSKFLSSDVVTEFRGRGDEIRLYPLNFSEFRSVFDGTDKEAWREFYTYGGMPFVASLKSEEQKTSHLQSVFRRVYLTDIIERYSIKNVDDMDELVNVLASGTGSLTNPKKLSDTFRSKKGSGIAPATVKAYLGYLEDAFLIDKALQFDLKGKQYINTPLKYYFTDVGIRNAKLNFRQQEENHIMENILFNELKIRGFAVDIGVVDIREKNRQGKYVRKRLEVDFVANAGSRRYYVQSALNLDLEEKARQEKRPLKNIGDSFKKIIVVKDDIKLKRDENGFVIMGIQEFLLNPDSLNL